jgi:tetratricopeptide (TPR) repeat protein
VRYVLEGSVQQVADNIRVTTQLIDGETGRHIWSENYDRKFDAEGFFYILDDIAGEVVDSLQATLSVKSMAVLERDTTTSTDALKLYLLGTQYLREPKSDESLANAVNAFESAIEEDARFAQAHAGLCDANLAWYVMTRDTDYFEKAEKPCLRALTLDDTLGEVYAAMGSLHRYAGRYDEAQIDLEKARELMPHSAPVLEELGRVYRYQGDTALAERTFTEAIIAEPSSWSVYKSLGNFLYRTGRYEEAVPLYQRVIEIEPAATVGYNNLGSAYFMLNRFEDATRAWDHIINDKPSLNTVINYANSMYYQSKYKQSVQMLERALEMSPDDYRTWENLAASLRHIEGASAREAEVNLRVIELAMEALRVNPDDADALAAIALTYVRSGDHEMARRTLAALYESGWDDPNVSFYVALVHLELGEKEAALKELEHAVETGFPINLIVADPDFESLHQEPRFAALNGPD